MKVTLYHVTACKCSSHVVSVICVYHAVWNAVSMKNTLCINKIVYAYVAPLILTIKMDWLYFVEENSYSRMSVM